MNAILNNLFRVGAVDFSLTIEVGFTLCCFLQKIYDYCTEAIDRGLEMDELPLSTENPAEVKDIIIAKLRAKEKSNKIESIVDSGETQNKGNSSKDNEVGK